MIIPDRQRVEKGFFRRAGAFHQMNIIEFFIWQLEICIAR